MVLRGDLSGGRGCKDSSTNCAIGFRAREGFREPAVSNTVNSFGDLGYKFSDQVENRFYLTMRPDH